MIEITACAPDLRIDGLELEDYAVARLIESTPVEDRPSLVADMLEVGARIIQREQDGAAGELLRREVDRLREELDRAQQSLVETSVGTMGQSLRPVIQSVADHLATINGRLDGVLAVADRDAAIEAERDRGTAKGRPFEESLAEALDAIARHRGDGCEHVGDTGGIGGRAGDVVVDVDSSSGPPQGRIVFEAKTGRLSRPEAMRELDRARGDRDAQFAVLVVAGAQRVPATTFQLHEYGGNSLIVAWDPDDEVATAALEIAYSLARARVLLSRQSGEEIDASAARQALERALQSLDEARRLKLQMTSIVTSAEGARALVDDMVARIREHIEAASSALRLGT